VKIPDVPAREVLTGGGVDLHRKGGGWSDNEPWNYPIDASGQPINNGGAPAGWHCKASDSHGNKEVACSGQ